MRIVCSILAYLASFWTEYKERQALKYGRLLNRIERDFAKKLKISDLDKIRILEVEKITHPFSWLFTFSSQFSKSVISSPIGLTLGNAVLIEKKYGQRLHLIIHELVHVSQYEQFGSHHAFLKEYIFQCLDQGYHNCPLEMEAEELANSLCSRNQV